jgi:hypothetical protein
MKTLTFFIMCISVVIASLALADSYTELSWSIGYLTGLTIMVITRFYENNQETK